MAWKSLKDPRTGLDKRPRVLAGPMLRKVTPTHVTVWLALRTACNVTLTVLDGTTRVKQGSGRTVAVGKYLHIVAVTAKPLPVATDLVEGKIYVYDLSFEYDDQITQTLGEATDYAKLAYPGFTLPSFCLPPADLTKLRIMHGSCRIPHGNGTDALPYLDGLIAQAVDQPSVRPHQLLLTGDQIYADDVGFAMSAMLTDASEALMGWTEEIVCNVPSSNNRRKMTEMNPGLRGHITQNDAGFTSVDFLGQLIGLGEYLAMYLFVWSDVLWPAAGETLPTVDELVAFFSPRESSVDSEVLHSEIFRMGSHADRGAVTSQTARTAQFGRTIKDNVRRALANIPTYMIFDDHEITDDWNMTRSFCEKVYGSPLGLRIVQNGLTAYALCQHWGNVPEQFTGGGPGEKLLALLNNMSSATAYDSASARIASLVGIHDDAALKTQLDNANFHDPGSLTYNYTIEGDGHQVIVTDTRTWRAYPRGPHEAGDMLPTHQLRDQIAMAPPLKKNRVDRMLLVVLSTNAPASQPIRSASRLPSVTKFATGVLPTMIRWAGDVDAFPDLYESWEMPRNGTDWLFKMITDQLPVVNGKRTGSVLLLSGDVHTSFCSRMLFRGSTRYMDNQGSPQPVNMVFVQMVSSSLRKQTDKTEGMHVDGYTYAPTGTGWLVPDHKPELYLGWNLPVGTTKRVGMRKNNPGSGRSYTPIKIKGPRTYSIWDMPHGFKEEVPHDWSYRLDYLVAVQEATRIDPPPRIPPLPTGNSPADRKTAAEIFNKATSHYRTFLKANVTRRQMVGLNNLGEITFDAKHAVHTLRWREESTATDKFTTYPCSLDPDDPVFLEKVGLLP
ncbi:hypothetical protein BH11MYX3_BH11MYX3_14260 [soil metagenome]